LLLALTQAVAHSFALTKALRSIGRCFSSRPWRKAAEQHLCDQYCQSLPGALALRPGVKHQTDPTPPARHQPHRDYASVQAERITLYLSLCHRVGVGKY